MGCAVAQGYYKVGLTAAGASLWPERGTWMPLLPLGVGLSMGRAEAYLMSKGAKATESLCALALRDQGALRTMGRRISHPAPAVPGQ
jgi:hypothetical protein